MKQSALYKILVFMCLAAMVSCVEEQDFKQYDDVSVTPTLEGSILYVETPERIINEVSGVSFITQDFNFDAFSEEFVAQRALDGTVTYEVENTTSKQLNITVEFIDISGNILDTENFLIDPAPTAILQREIAYGGVSGRSIDIIRNTSGLRVSAENLSGNNSVSSLPDPKIILRSSAKIRIRLK